MVVAAVLNLSSVPYRLKQCLGAHDSLTMLTDEYEKPSDAAAIAHSDALVTGPAALELESQLHPLVTTV